jgi:release factor glutamine methyltransferase
MDIPFALYCDIPHKTLQRFLMHAINVRDLHKVILHNRLNDIERQKFEDCIVRYRCGTPVEYITEECNFYGIDFIVNNSVLIPRVDTEILVENVVNFIEERHLKVLDLCTGSGCIAVSIAKHCKNASILAVDISPEALKICDTNVETHKLEGRIKTQICDITKGIPYECDVIVSNPPYIQTSVIDDLEKSVKDFEPRIALDGGADGLQFYRHIFQYMRKNMPVFLEIGFDQGDVITKLAKSFGNCDVKIIKDYGNNDRVCVCNV